jgi:hypothetical protein
MKLSKRGVGELNSLVTIDKQYRELKGSARREVQHELESRLAVSETTWITCSAGRSGRP